jgi:hypothetical protein
LQNLNVYGVFPELLMFMMQVKFLC